MMGVFKDPRWTNALIIFNGFYSDVSTYRNPSFFLLVNMLKRVPWVFKDVLHSYFCIAFMFNGGQQVYSKRVSSDMYMEHCFLAPWA